MDARAVVTKLIGAANAALHDRMYREWPAVADLLKEAIKEGEAYMTRWSPPESLHEGRERELRLLVERRQAMEAALEVYRKLAADYKKIEECILGHYPRGSRPGPFFYNGMVIECRDEHDDGEWRFELTAAIVVQPTSSG